MADDEVELVFWPVGGAGGVPDGRGGELRCHQHVRAVVLHRFEGADRPAELHPFFGVGDRRLGARGHDSNCLRGSQRAGQSPGAARRADQHVRGDGR